MFSGENILTPSVFGWYTCGMNTLQTNDVYLVSFFSAASTHRQMRILKAIDASSAQAIVQSEIGSTGYILEVQLRAAT